eukprot:1060881-Prymnesium_polylepis.1
MVLLQLLFESVALLQGIRQQRKLHRLRYCGGNFVELPRMTEKEFTHLPGLEQTRCYHLFLSRASGAGTSTQCLNP